MTPSCLPWLYRSQWNRESPTLHVLPHWTWPGREGEKVPVVCYTSYPMAELFVNGVSQGVARFDPSDLLRRYRLVWPDVIYEPGEIEVVAYDEKDYEMDRVSVRTAGAPDGIKLSVDRKVIDADGLDLAYVTVSIVDADGNLCPAATDAVTFDVSGAGSFRAAANGDATCLVPFQSKTMPAFSGQLTAIVQSSDTPGTITLNATAEGLTSNSITIKTK